MVVHFKKYHALGNDYLVIDPNVKDIKLSPKSIRLICSRNYGFGSDGILYRPTDEAAGNRLNHLWNLYQRLSIDAKKYFARIKWSKRLDKC